MDKKFSLIVKEREGIVFQGIVESITSFNEKGVFDVLAQHANYISLIEKVLIVGELNGSVKEIKISNGLMRVRENYVEVYLGIEGSKRT